VFERGWDNILKRGKKGVEEGVGENKQNKKHLKLSFCVFFNISKHH
jgi:hypothetical protein